MDNELEIIEPQFDATPAYQIEELKQKVYNGEATPEEIEEYINIRVEYLTKEAIQKAQDELLESYMQARIQAQQADATSARLNLQSVAYEAIKGFMENE